MRMVAIMKMTVLELLDSSSSKNGILSIYAKYARRM